MKTLFNNEFGKINYDESKKLLTSEWKLATENMTTEQMQFIIKEFVKLIVQYKPIYLFSNDSKNNYFYKVDEQKWVANQIVGAIIKSGVKKYAIILPENLIGEVATEQTVEEAGDLPNKLKNVKSEEEAMNWFFH